MQALHAFLDLREHKERRDHTEGTKSHAPSDSPLFCGIQVLAFKVLVRILSNRVVNRFISVNFILDITGEAVGIDSF